MTHSQTTARRAAVLGCVALAAALSAPAANAAGAPTPPAKRVSIEFVAMNHGVPVSCATPLTNLGTTGATAALKDLRFYISNVRLVRADGRAVPLRLTGARDYNATVGPDRVSLIDLENGTGACVDGDPGLNRVIRGTVPAGRYTGVHMQLGVPFRLNHGDITTAPRPLDLAALSWGWQAGRKFTQIEVTDPAGANGTWSSRSFLVHIGSTGCTGNPATGAIVNCARSNRAAIRLARFNPDRQRIAVNLSGLFLGVDVTRNTGGGAGCMSGATDPECGPIFDALRVDGTGTGLPVDGGRGQRLFRVVPR